MEGSRKMTIGKEMKHKKSKLIISRGGNYPIHTLL